MASNTDEIKKIKKQVNEIKDSMKAILDFMEKNQKKEDETEKTEKTEDIEAVVSKILEKMNNEPEKKTVKLNNDNERDVLFISLCLGTLNLSTRKNGDGEIYTFHEFGEEQVIPYEDAKNIIKNNKSFIKGGKVYIDDPDLITKERLDKDYKNILDYRGLTNLFKADVDTFEKIFTSMPDGQKQSFKDILSQKILKGEKVDRNLIYIVNQELNIDIEKKIEDGKNLTE